MKHAILCMFVFCTSLARTEVHEKQAFAVWSGKNCIVLMENVRAIAPLKDGEPDYKNVHLTGVQLDNKCVSYEIK